MPGGLLPPPPTKASPKPRAKKRDAKPKQVQVDHDWSYIVLWYEELRRHNPRGWGVEMIGFPSIKAYAELFDLDMEPWEVDTLIKLDVAWFECLPKKAGRSSE